MAPAASCYRGAVWYRLLIIVCALAFPSGGRASDFWDEVRTPGLRAHATLMHEVAVAIRREEGHHALELLTRDPAIFADHPDTLRMRGLALALTGDSAGALQALQRAQQLDATVLDDVTWGTRAALIAAKSGHLAWASDIVARVVGGLPALPVRRELFSLLGDLLLTQGPTRLPEALVAYREALRGSTSTDVRSTLGLALALRRNGEPQAARDVMSRITAASRVDVVVNVLPLPESEKAARLAIAYEAVGDVEQALTQWAAAAALPMWQAQANAEANRLHKEARPRERTRKP